MLKISFLYKNRLSYESLIMVSNTRSTMCVRGFWRQILVYTLLVCVCVGVGVLVCL